MRTGPIFAIFFILCTAASCERKPGRPDAPLCTSLDADPDSFECTDQRGDFKHPRALIMGTTLEGYATMENYVDALELENRRLRRECRR